MSSNKTTVHATRYLKPARKIALLEFRKKYAEKLQSNLYIADAKYHTTVVF